MSVYQGLGSSDLTSASVAAGNQSFTSTAYEQSSALELDATVLATWQTNNPAHSRHTMAPLAWLSLAHYMIFLLKS